MITTLGKQQVKSALPEKFRAWADQPLTKKRIQQLTTQIAKELPDDYVNILQKLNAIGQNTVSNYGKDTTVTLDDLSIGAEVRDANKKIRQLISGILNAPGLSSEQKENKIKQLGYKYSQKVQDLVVQDAIKRKSGFASQMLSGSRGNPIQMMQMLFGNMMMRDALNRDIPYIAVDPYAQGVSPMAYWVGASSGRKGTYDVQAATARAGYLGKQATNITHATPISMQDCGTQDTGIVVPATNPDNQGALLMRPFHNHPAGSPVTAAMMAQADDGQQMLLRSPTTCKAKHGVCAHCSGIQQNGKFPAVGEYVPLNAAKTFIQAATQAGVGCLHPGTRVRMSDWSTKQIKDIRAGDMVIGVDLDGRYKPVKVLRLYDKGLQDLYLYTYRAGYCTSRKVALCATTNHKALQATRKSRCLDQLNNNLPRILPVGQQGKHIGMFLPTQPAQAFTGLQVPQALFLGLILGDGCYTKGIRYRVAFSCADNSLVQDLQPYMSSLGLKFVKHKGSPFEWMVINKQPNNVPGKIRQLNKGRLLLDKHGIKDKYAKDKALPNGYQQWDSASISAALSGLIITDGSLYIEQGYKYTLGFVSTSLKLVLQVREMLAKHAGVISPSIKRHVKQRKNILYGLEIHKRSQVLKALKFLKLYGIKEQRRLAFIEHLQRDLASRRSVDLINIYKRLQTTHIGYRQAYDIQVDCQSHLFLLANGLVVSNSKHVGGVGGKKVQDPQGQDQPTGFDSVERMFSAPDKFPGGAILAQADGRINSIQPAPQGGSYITVGSQVLYSPQARTIQVKVGDTVEAGDMLTNGVPNPMQVVHYKGLGQGRRYYTDKLYDILKKANFGTARRNVQQFSRSFINKVQITDPDGYKGHYPGDIVDYDDLAASWQPRQTSKKLDTNRAVGNYLQAPALHYTIGTKITPRVAKTLDKYNFKQVLVNDQPPPFDPQFVRSKFFMIEDKNWIPRFSGQRVKSAIFDAAQRGMTDQYGAPSFVDKIVAQPYKP